MSNAAPPPPPSAFPVPEVLSLAVREPGRVAVGDRAETRLAPGLLGWLMTPPAPGAPPPARGTHPMSGLPLGLAVEAAITAASGRRNGLDTLRAARVEYESPIRAEEPALARAEITARGRRHVTARVEVRSAADNRLLLRGEVTLVRVDPATGRAADLTSLYAD